MAKSKSFFGLRRGSTKSHTYQVLRGEQITKDRVYDVANPQSNAQMEQRLKLPMVANARAILKGLVNHSFEGVQYGEPSLREFSARNLRSGYLTIVSYVPKGIGDCGVADYLVSKGMAPDCNITEYDAANKVFVCNVVSQQANLYEGGTAPTANSALTAAQIAYIFQNLDTDLPQTSQLTMLFARRSNTPYSYAASDGTTKTGWRHTFIVSRFIFDPDRTSEMSAWKWLDGGKLTDGYVTLQLVEKDGNKVFAWTTNTVDVSTVEMAAVIASDYSGTVWRRSTTRMYVVEDNIAVKVTYDNVINGYLKSTTTSGSDKYLNTGTEGVNITGGN